MQSSPVTQINGQEPESFGRTVADLLVHLLTNYLAATMAVIGLCVLLALVVAGFLVWAFVTGRDFSLGKLGTFSISRPGSSKRAGSSKLPPHDLQPAYDIYRAWREKQRWHLSDVTIKNIIYPNYDVENIRSETISPCSKDDPIFYIGHTVGGDSPATLKEINFTVEADQKDRNIFLVPAEDHKRKRFLLFFHPPLVGPNDTVRITARHRWPRAAKTNLSQGDWDDHSFKVPDNIDSPIDKVSLLVETPNRNYEVEADDARRHVDEEQNGRLYRLKDTNIGGGRQLMLRVRKRS